MCCSVNISVCLVCCVFDSVCELFGETIRKMFGCVDSSYHIPITVAIRLRYSYSISVCRFSISSYAHH